MQHELLECIATRRSVRAYQPRPLPKELIQQVVQAGLQAPSAHDSRPWHFGVFTGQAKQGFVATMQQPFATDLAAAGFTATEITEKCSRAARIYTHAPCIIVAFCKQDLPQNRLDGEGWREALLAAQSVALAGGQMQLAAHALGLGSCWFAAPLFCAQEVSAHCGLSPAQWAPQYLITLGWPAPEEKKQKRPIAPTEQVVYY